MDLILGGAYQGKLTWCVKEYNLSPSDLCDLEREEPTPGKGCYYHLEALTRRETDPQRYLPLFKDAVVIAREIGGGVVPKDKEERAWRERHGQMLQVLAADAACVVRVFCGLTEELK